MKKKLGMVATIVVVLFINACTLQNKACYVNEKQNRQPAPQTHLYNSQIPIKNKNLNINRHNANVPSSVDMHPDKYQMLYQNPSSGTESTGPR